MKRSFLAFLADNYIRIFHRITKKSVSKKLKTEKQDKDNYHIPIGLKFPRELTCDIYDGMQVFEMLPQKEVKTTIMYLHGGGYINNFSIYHWKFLISLAKKRGYGLTVPNYPLLPKYTYKESHQKVLSYYKEYSKKNSMENIVIAGDSAGGGFVLSLLQELKQVNLPLPKKAILISPFVDVTGANKALSKKDSLVDYEATILIERAWANNENPKLPAISPLYGDCKDLPPIEIYVGTNEILYDQCIALSEKLKQSGNDVKIHIGHQMGHDYPIYPIPEGYLAREQMIKFIEKDNTKS